MALREEPRPWRDGRFRLFAAGNLTNNLGEGMYTFAMPLLALSYTGSLATMALLVAVTPLVITIGGPLLGHLVDRYGSRVVVVPGLLLQLLASVALNIVLSGGPVPIWMLYAAEILVQIGAVSYRAGWLAGVPAMFPECPGRARGSLTVLFQVSLILGPTLAAALVGPMGFTGLLWLNSATFVAPLLVWFAGVNPVAGQDRYRVVATSLVESLRQGLHVFTRNGKMGTLISLMAPVSFAFSTATITLFVYLATSRLGASISEVGFALAVANIGGVVGAFVTAEIPRWQIRTLTVIALISATTCLVTIGAGVGLIVATAAMTLFLLCDNIIAVATEMEMFSSVPPELSGRATGMWRLATGLPSIAAPAAIAVMNSHLSPQTIFLVLAVVCAAPLVWLLTHRAALRVEAPHPEPPTTGEPAASPGPGDTERGQTG